MNIFIESLSFNYGSKIIFENFSLALNNKSGLPVVILGPSGCGKTTLLKIVAGLLTPEKGELRREKDSETIHDPHIRSGAAFVFQEPRLLPWFTVLENISLPLEKIFGKKESRERALHFLDQVSLADKASVYPDKISGGQLQRASIARAFAYPSDLLLMDEPFHSLDIPLRIELMELCLSLLEKEKRLSLAITHDPREAVFMGSRIIILGQPPCGIVFDREVQLAKTERGYGAASTLELEKAIIENLRRKQAPSEA